ncbi:MAG: PAS domain S-box protein, partial [Planctomycetota bacterium]
MRREAAGLNLDGEAVLEAAFDHLYNAMVITDADFDGGPFIQRCNPAFCAMTGYTEEELIGRSLRILQGPDTDRKVIDQLNRKIRAGEFFEGSTVNYRKDGVAYVVQWNISPVRDAAGAIAAYISIQHDITARFAAEREAEEARRQQAKSDERYRRSMDHAAIGMCLISADGRFVEVNDALCQLFGYDAETLTQKTWQELTAPEYLEADLNNV